MTRRNVGLEAFFRTSARRGFPARRLSHTLPMSAPSLPCLGQRLLLLLLLLIRREWNPSVVRNDALIAYRSNPVVTPRRLAVAVDALWFSYIAVSAGLLLYPVPDFYHDHLSGQATNSWYSETSSKVGTFLDLHRCAQRPTTSIGPNHPFT